MIYITVFRLAVAVVLTLSAGGCVQNGMGIGSAVTECCTADYSRYATFEVTAKALPPFLRPMIEEELATALEERGLRRERVSGDLLVNVNLSQVVLDEPLTHDPFQGSLDPGGESRFLADLTIEMVDRATGDEVWRGVVSRIHNVVPGETMPVERARAAIGEAFRDVFENYPIHTAAH